MGRKKKRGRGRGKRRKGEGKGGEEGRMHFKYSEEHIRRTQYMVPLIFTSTFSVNWKTVVKMKGNLFTLMLP